MTHKLATACFVIGTLMAPMAAYSADPDTDRSNPEAFVKDSVITTKVKTKLASEHLGSIANVRVDTDKDGVVFLSGIRSHSGRGQSCGRPGARDRRRAGRSTASSPSSRKNNCLNLMCLQPDIR